MLNYKWLYESLASKKTCFWAQEGVYKSCVCPFVSHLNIMELEKCYLSADYTCVYIDTYLRIYS